MAKLTFETAALADALRRAEKIAPSRGEAFDKAAGIIFDIREDVTVIKANNLVSQFSTWITPHETEGAPVTWRLSSRILTEVIGKLRTGQHSQVVLEDDSRQVKMTHGRTRGAFGKMDPSSYPDWTPFDSADMQEVEGLADISARVQWAASKGSNAPLTGVHFTGELAVATDRYRVCCMPLAMELKEPITVPSGVLNAVLPPGAPVLCRVDKHQMHLMPDEYTQISTVIYGLEFPPIQRIMKRDYPQMVTVQRSYMLDMLGLANTMSGANRNPVMRLFLGGETLAAMMEAQGEGHLGDIMELPGQATNARLEKKFVPDYLIGALENMSSPEVILGYETDPSMINTPMYLHGGQGDEYWLAPMSPQAAAAAQAEE